MTNKRGGRRPGAGRKPGKMSAAKLSIAQAARELGEEALQMLMQVARDPTSPASARVGAATAILDRGFGKPVTQPPEPPTDGFADVLKEISQQGSKAPISTSYANFDGENDEVEP